MSIAQPLQLQDEGDFTHFLLLMRTGIGIQPTKRHIIVALCHKCILPTQTAATVNRICDHNTLASSILKCECSEQLIGKA